MHPKTHIYPHFYTPYGVLINIYPRKMVVGSLRFAKIMLGWKTYTYYCETDLTHQPKANPTQEKTGEKWHVLGHFSPPQVFFRALGLILCRKQTTRNPKCSANTLVRCFFF